MSTPTPPPPPPPDFPRRRHRIPIQPEQIDHIAAMWQAGSSVADIADYLGISHTQASTIIRRLRRQASRRPDTHANP